MAVKIINASPRNGDQNVPVVNGQISCTGTVDENATWVNAQLTDGTTTQVGAQEFINKNQQWHYQFNAALNTNYSLTVTGTNSEGVGSSTIMFKTAIRGGVHGGGGEAKKVAGKPVTMKSK
jgi:hypothetical protein